MDFADVRTATVQAGQAFTYYCGWYSGNGRVEQSIEIILKQYGQYSLFSIPGRIVVNIFYIVQEGMGDNLIKEFGAICDFIMNITHVSRLVRCVNNRYKIC